MFLYLFLVITVNAPQQIQMNATSSPSPIAGAPRPMLVPPQMAAEIAAANASIHRSPSTGSVTSASNEVVSFRFNHLFSKIKFLICFCFFIFFKSEPYISFLLIKFIFDFLLVSDVCQIIFLYLSLVIIINLFMYVGNLLIFLSLRNARKIFYSIYLFPFNLIHCNLNNSFSIRFGLSTQLPMVVSIIIIKSPSSLLG